MLIIPLDFIGNNHIFKYFQNAINNGNLSHAYLYNGIEGVGKKQFGYIIARTLGQDQKLKKDLVNNNFLKNPDLHCVGTNGEAVYIDDIKDIKVHVSKSPVFLKKKIVILDNVERLNKESSNALLKILEEPQS